MDYSRVKKQLKRFWHFVWHDDSLASWVVNVILAFVIIKFLVYPVLGFAFSTTHPIVAVVSGSMEHKIALDGSGVLRLCGERFDERHSVDFDFFWDTCGSWYEDEVGITRDQFDTFKFHNGFNKGDIIVIYGTDPVDLRVGDVVVFSSYRPDPIIHRIVSVDDGFFQTKGDHNSESFAFEQRISVDSYVGRAVFRIPLLGWIKILFVDFISLFR